MRNEPARLGEKKIFHMNTCKWASPARWDRVFLNQFCFFRLYCMNELCFSWLYVTVYCKKYFKT